MANSDILSVVSIFVTIMGIVVTVVAAIIAVHQAVKAKDYSEKLKTAVKRVGLLTIAERLRVAQDPIEQLPHTERDLRGNKPAISIGKIRSELVAALSSLDKNGPGSEARSFLSKAQECLNQYEDSTIKVRDKIVGATLDFEAKRKIRNCVQDAVSELLSASDRLEK